MRRVTSIYSYNAVFLNVNSYWSIISKEAFVLVKSSVFHLHQIIWIFNCQLFIQKKSCASSSVLLLFIAALWPVMAEGTWSWQTHFQEAPSRDRASSVREKRADCNANFPALINLQYGIRALSPRGCTLLLYSISQLLPAITVNPHCPPHTKPLLHYIYLALYKRQKHMTAALRAVFAPGLGGPLLEEGSLQLAHCASLPWAGQQWHREGHWFSSPSHSRHLLYFHLEMFTDVFKKLSKSVNSAVRCVSGACGMSLITWTYTSNCATSSPRCSALCPRFTSSYESLRLFTSLSAE